MDTTTTPKDDALVSSVAEEDGAEGGTEEGDGSDGEAETEGASGGDSNHGKRRKQPLSVSAGKVGLRARYLRCLIHMILHLYSFTLTFIETL